MFVRNLLVFLTLLVGAQAQSLFACQANTQPALRGCPPGTIYVSATDPAANFKTISAAAASLPNDASAQVILIGPGTYTEKASFRRRGPTTVLGVTSSPTDSSKNTVNVQQSTYVDFKAAQPAGNADQTTFYIVSSSDFKLYNVNLENSFGLTSQLGPSAAIYVERCTFSSYNSNYRSFQDTVFVGRDARALFWSGVIEGQTDWLYGYGIARLESVTLKNRGCGGGITAWKGTPGTKAGIYINNSHLTGVASPKKKCFLGRPWNSDAISIYLNTRMDDVIAPTGFTVWSASDTHFVKGSTIFAEYQSSGPGANDAARDKNLQSILGPADAAQYSLTSVFGERPAWIDYVVAKV